MSKTKIVLSSFAILTPVVWAITFFGSEGALCERHSGLDPKIVRKLHHEIYLEVLKGKHTDLREDADWDALLLSKYDNLHR